MLNLITSRAVALYSIGFKAATRRGHDFNSARRAGLACERAFIANEIKRAVNRSRDCHVVEWGGSVDRMHSMEFCSI